MQNKLMIIDCENCYSKSLINILNKHYDWQYIFVEGANQNIDKSAMYGDMSVEKCKTAGHNSADFVILAMAILKCSSKAYKRVAILSNDKGYDSAIRYLKGNGIKIERFDSNYIKGEFRKTLPGSGYKDDDTSKSKKSKKQTKTNYGDKIKNELIYLTAEANSNGKHIVYTTYLTLPRFNNFEAFKMARVIRKLPCGTSLEKVCKKARTVTSISDSDIALTTLARNGLIRVIKNKRNGAIQVYWSKRELDRFIRNFYNAGGGK